METNDYRTLVTTMKNTFISNMTGQGQKVTDMNEGSIIMTMFEAVGNILEQAYINTRLGFQNNLNSIATSVFDFKKKEGQAATVEVKFSRAVALNTPVTIPSGTIVSDGSHNFVTSMVATIPADEIESNLVPAQANSIGSEYNVSAGTVNIIVSSVSSQVIAVNNPNKSSGGADGESSVEMLARFKKYINGLQGTNKYGLEAGLLENGKVRSVSIVEHPDSPNGIHATVYVDDGTGSLTDELKQELVDLVNGDGTSIKPGLRATGVNIDIQPCTQVPISITARITLYRVEESVADAALKDTLDKTINGLKVNEDVLFADVMTALKQTGSYVKNIKNLALNGVENSDVSISSNQIARLGNIQFTYDYWGE